LSFVGSLSFGSFTLAGHLENVIWPTVIWQFVVCPTVNSQIDSFLTAIKWFEFWSIVICQFVFWKIVIEQIDSW
jgi:hypothetical protein